MPPVCVWQFLWDPTTPFITYVYQKPTYTDQYVYWDTNHILLAKYSVSSTLNI